MDIFNQIYNIVIFFLDFFSLIKIILLIVSLIILYHILVIIIRDRNYIKAFKEHKDPLIISIDDLEYIPLVNIIIPAWNEGETFRQCLESITKLNYPKLKVIVNAGGSEKTIKIANSFKKFDYFKILSQEGGGKLRAINECFQHVTEGILYLVDADVNLVDEILLRMIYPIVNMNEQVIIGGVRPQEAQEDMDLIKYLRINRNTNFRFKFSRYRNGHISGANTCIDYKVMKAIGKFSVDKVYAVEAAQGNDIMSKGFKIYRLTDYRGRIYSKLPSTFKAWVKQKIRWNENHLVYSYQKKKRDLLKFLLIFLVSLYLLIFLFFILIHLSFVLFGIYILLNIYLKKIRRIIFTKKLYGKYFHKLGIIFFFKIIVYIYIEALIYVYIAFEWFFFGSKKLKKRKNILDDSKTN